MINLTITDINPIVVFAVCFTRWITVIIQLPIFDNTSIPAMLKVLIAMLITYSFYPHMSTFVNNDLAVLGQNGFWILTMFNAIVGLFIGYFVKAILNVFFAAGAIITQQIGFSAIRYFDPSAGTQVGPFEKLIYWTMLVLVINSGALLPMFKAVMISFERISITHFVGASNLFQFFLHFFKEIFHSSLLLASPIIFLNVLITAVLGFVARTVPQMNVLMVSFVVNIGLGLLIFFATSEEFFQTGYRIYTEQLGMWFQYINQ